jgi:hypothetical protein
MANRYVDPYMAEYMNRRWGGRSPVPDLMAPPVSQGYTPGPTPGPGYAARPYVGPSYGTIVPTTGAPVPPPLGWSGQPRTTPFQAHTPAPALGGGGGPRPVAPVQAPAQAPPWVPPDSQISWSLGKQPTPAPAPAPTPSPVPVPAPVQPSPWRPRSYYGPWGPIAHQDLADWFFGLFFPPDARAAAQENARQEQHNQSLLPGGYLGDGRARATTPYFVR